MSSASDYIETIILDHITGNSVYSAPGVLYLALFTSDAGLETGIITSEVSGVNYERKPIIFNPAVQNQIQNANTILFPQAGTGGWGTITHCAVMDSVTNGNVLFHSTVSPSTLINEGDTFRVNIATLTITIT